VKFQDLFVDSASLDSFLVSQFGVDVVHLRGPSGRFAELRRSASEAPESATATGRFMRSVERTLEAAVHVYSAHESNPESSRDRLIFHTGGPPFSYVVRKHEAVVWAGRLEDGDALCVPVGHQSVGPGGPHLVLELLRPSAVDLLTWAARAARSRPELQEPAPFFATLSVQARYLEDVRRAVAEFLSSPQLLEVFRRRMNGQASARVIGGETPSVPAQSASDDHIAELTAPRPLHFLPKGAAFSIHTGGKHLDFPSEALPVLLTLERRAPITLRDLRREFESEMDPGDLDDLLDVLTSNGVIRICAREESS
jgi:hypothetical protein